MRSSLCFSLLLAVCVSLPALGTSLDTVDDATGDAFGACPTYGAVSTFTRTPTPPGFPEGIALFDGRAYVSAPAAFVTVGLGPTVVFVHDRFTGALLRRIPIQGTDLSREHPASEVAVDGYGRVYVSDNQQGILRITPGGLQQRYSTPFPDLPTCASVPAGTPCSPTAVNRPPLVNGLAFDAHGNLYVTDSFQATLWRIPAGGGTPRIYFQDARLDAEFGPNGIAIDPGGHFVYFTVSGFDVGVIYRLPLLPWRPTAADLHTLVTLPGQGPDGLAFGAQGWLYVALAIPNQVGVFDMFGQELLRLPPPGAPVGSIPVDGPSAIAFDAFTHTALVVNHAPLTGNPEHFGVLRFCVNDPGWPLNRPFVP
jgi:DNA-binding beta-propeller fold protein YncE